MEKYTTASIENLRKTSECDVMFDKHRRQTLAVTLFNLCYMFYVVFVKCTKLCIVPHIIAQIDLPKDEVYIYVFISTTTKQTRLICAIGWESWTKCHCKFCGTHFEDRMFLISRLWQVKLDMAWRESGSKKVPFKLGDAKIKRISSLVQKLKKRRVCMSDNRVTLRANYWTFTGSRIRK